MDAIIIENDHKNNIDIINNINKEAINDIRFLLGLDENSLDKIISSVS